MGEGQKEDKDGIRNITTSIRQQLGAKVLKKITIHFNNHHLFVQQVKFHEKNGHKRIKGKCDGINSPCESAPL